MKTVTQLSEMTTAEGSDLLHMVDKSQNQDMKMQKANFHNSKPYGEMYITQGADDITVSVINTYYNITNGGAVTTTPNLLNKVVHTNGRLTYTADEPIVTEVNLVMSGFAPTNDSSIRVAVYKSGIKQDNLECLGRVIASSPDAITVAVSGLLNLVKDDYLEVFVYNTSGAYAIRPVQLNLSFKQL